MRHMLPGAWLPPEYAMNFADIGNAILTFGKVPTGYPPRVWVEMETDHVINLGDIQFLVSAFQGVDYASISLPLIGNDPKDCP